MIGPEFGRSIFQQNNLDIALWSLRSVILMLREERLLRWMEL
jgi:hypothetical protein